MIDIGCIVLNHGLLIRDQQERKGWAKVQFVIVVRWVVVVVGRLPTTWLL
jgi:hypothetical protein